MTARLACAAVAAAAVVLAVLAWWWRRPGWLSSLAAAVVLCDLVAVPWAALSALTVGPASPLRLTWADPGGSYARLLAGPTGNASWFGGVTLGVTLCVLTAGRRRRRAKRQKPPVVLASSPPAASRPRPGAITPGRGVMPPPSLSAPPAAASPVRRSYHPAGRLPQAAGDR